MNTTAVNDWAFDFLQVKESWSRLDPAKLAKIKIAFIDTGYDPARLEGKDIDIVNISLDPDQTAFDLTGHGTLFASILHRYTHMVNGGKPKIISIRAGNASNLPVSDIIHGIRRAIEEQVDVLSINVCNVYYNAQMTRLLYQAAEQGMIPIAPSGNMIRGEYTFPASLETVIASTSISQAGELLDYVNAHKYTDVGAPEEDAAYHIGHEELQQITAVIQGMFGQQEAVQRFPHLNVLDQNPFSGTSFSLPMVVAVAAYMKAINNKLRVKDIRDILKYRNNARVLNQPDTDIGILNFPYALDEVDNLNPHPRELQDQLFFQFSHNLEPGCIFAQVHDLTGNPRRSLDDTTVTLSVFPYNPMQTREADNIITSQTLELQEGTFKWDFKHLDVGNYFLRVKDESGRVTEALSMIKQKG
jgi:Subtilase family